MKNFTLVAVTLFLSFANQANADWNTILRCDNGNVWVDVNSSQRTQVQLVSRNRQANHYFEFTLGTSLSSAGGGDWEVTWSGLQPQGVYGPADFQGATYSRDFANQTYPKSLLGDYVQTYKEYVSFFRVEGDALKVQVTRRDLNKCVNNAYDGRFGRCSQGTYYVAYQYVGDWIFKNCK